MWHLFLSFCTFIGFNFFADHGAVEMLLSESDYAEIYNILKPYASKWSDIGSALGFSEGELDNIQSNHTLLTQSPPMSHLREMLCQWLQWAPRDGRGSKSHATRESLVAALMKVPLGKPAEKINQLQ